MDELPPPEFVFGQLSEAQRQLGLERLKVEAFRDAWARLDLHTRELHATLKRATRILEESSSAGAAGSRSRAQEALVQCKLVLAREVPVLPAPPEPPQHLRPFDHRRALGLVAPEHNGGGMGMSQAFSSPASGMSPSDSGLAGATQSARLPPRPAGAMRPPPRDDDRGDGFHGGGFGAMYSTLNASGASTASAPPGTYAAGSTTAGGGMRRPGMPRGVSPSPSPEPVRPPGTVAHDAAPTPGQRRAVFCVVCGFIFKPGTNFCGRCGNASSGFVSPSGDGSAVESGTSDAASGGVASPAFMTPTSLPPGATPDGDVSGGPGMEAWSSSRSLNVATFPDDAEATIYMDGRVAGFVIHVRHGTSTLQLRWCEVFEGELLLYRRKNKATRPRLRVSLADVSRIERVDFDDEGYSSDDGSTDGESDSAPGAYYAEDRGQHGSAPSMDATAIAAAEPGAGGAGAGGSGGGDAGAGAADEAGDAEEAEAARRAAAAAEVYGLPNEWVFRLVTPGGVYTLCSPDEESLYTWLRVIVEASGVDISVLPSSALQDAAMEGHSDGDERPRSLVRGPHTIAPAAAGGAGTPPMRPTGPPAAAAAGGGGGASVPCRSCGINLVAGTRFCGRCGMGQDVGAANAWGAAGGATRPRPMHPSRSDTDLAALAKEAERSLQHPPADKGRKLGKGKKKKKKGRRRSMQPADAQEMNEVAGYKFKKFVKNAMVKNSEEDLAKETTTIESVAWVPNHLAKVCMFGGCTRKFGFKVRRHHCRLCGKVFCKHHSSQKIKLSSVAGVDPLKENRVCDTCYTRVKNGGPAIKPAPEAKEMSEEEAVRRKVRKKPDVAPAEAAAPPGMPGVGRPRGMSILDEIDLLGDDDGPGGGIGGSAGPKTLPMRGEPGFNNFRANLARLEAMGGGGGGGGGGVGSGGHRSAPGRGGRMRHDGGAGASGPRGGRPTGSGRPRPGAGSASGHWAGWNT